MTASWRRPSYQATEKQTRNITWRRIALFTLSLMVSISPRLHFGTLAFGKRLDLRLEDFFILVLLAYSLAVRTKLPRSNGVIALMTATIFSAMFSTFVGAFAGWIEPIRAIFYITKEIEYYLFFVLTLHNVRVIGDLWGLVTGFLIGAVINGTFILYQFGTGQYFGRDTNDYGVILFGEYASFNVSAYGGFVMLIGIGLLEVPGLKSKLLSGVLSVLGAACLLGGLSRTALISMSMVGLMWMILCMRTFSTKRLAYAFGAVTLIIAALMGTYGQMSASGGQLMVSRVAPAAFTSDNIRSNYTKARVDAVYADYLKAIASNPFSGLGKSITGTNLPIEAHNYCLRLLAEVGVVGLVLFVALMVKVLTISYRATIRAHDPRLRAVALCSFLYAVFLCITSLAQDTFIAPRVTEIFWISFAVLLRVDHWNHTSISQSRPLLCPRPALLGHHNTVIEPCPRYLY